MSALDVDGLTAAVIRECDALGLSLDRGADGALMAGTTTVAHVRSKRLDYYATSRGAARVPEIGVMGVIDQRTYSSVLPRRTYPGTEVGAKKAAARIALCVTETRRARERHDAEATQEDAALSALADVRAALDGIAACDVRYRNLFVTVTIGHTARDAGAARAWLRAVRDALAGLDLDGES